ncbi:MAG: fibronectin type III-like domain-contianing protein, partial [Roseburia sp.]|nr:fibronectin type III-like domain-contianing protein [Roseburia sp.]
SGRTIDTYARDFKKDPTYMNFANNNEENSNRYYVNGSKRAFYFVEYEEGIYVGYNYYETRGYTEAQAGKADWYKNNVVFPFGYGMSYTTFKWELINAAELKSAEKTAKSTLTAKVKVTNTGSYAGKEVVQVYVTAPYTPGEIEKSHVKLVGFGKTPMLYPKAQETETQPNSAIVEIEIPIYYFASYDYSDANHNEFKGYEIESGAYELKVCRDAHTVSESVTLDMPEIRIDEDPVTENPVENRFDDVSEHIVKYMSRTDFDGTFPTSPTDADRNVDKEFIASLNYSENDVDQKWTAADTPTQSKSELSYNKVKVKLYNLIGKDYKDPLWDELLNQLTIDQMVNLIGTGNYNTVQIENIAKPRTTDPDGPVGFTAFMGDPSVYDTCFYASCSVLGATYNTELAFEMGEMVGNEGLIGNKNGDGRTYSGWYAPAVNIHRSPFAGRNWEYYSEDGTLSGVMAANVVKGASSKGVYCYVKHFALNEQETARSSNGVLTWANEQAMREIYLRPFEITVKDGKTTAMMSSFNRIGKTWAGGSYELLTEVLRDEWGFRGMVITDYNYSTPYMNVDQMIRAGGDLNLSQGKFPNSNKTPTQITALRRATKNILYTVAGSNAMNGMGDGVVYRYAIPMWMRYMLVIDGVLVVILAVLGFFAIRRSFKLAKNEAGGGNADSNDESGASEISAEDVGETPGEETTHDNVLNAEIPSDETNTKADSGTDE